MRSSGYERADADWYQEPDWIVDALLDAEPFEGVCWDPSCGGGNIPKRLEARGMKTMASDMADRGYGSTGVDFVGDGLFPVVENIITNPPYGIIQPYIWRALRLTSRKVAILARLALLEGIKRQKMFRSTPLARVLVSSRREARIYQPLAAQSRMRGLSGTTRISGNRRLIGYDHRSKIFQKKGFSFCPSERIYNRRPQDGR
jgi:hypothetical protein